VLPSRLRSVPRCRTDDGSSGLARLGTACETWSRTGVRHDIDLVNPRSDGPSLPVGRGRQPPISLTAELSLTPATAGGVSYNENSGLPAALEELSRVVYEKQQVCRYLVTYQHLCDDAALGGSDSMVDYVRKVGCIQYDPLDVVGRNPDLVLQSRCRSYRKGDIGTYLYADRTLFDVWDKNMSICATSDWAAFERFRRNHLLWCYDHKDVVEAMTAYLMAHDCACSSDFDYEEKVSWHYGPQRLAKAALECMCYAGLAIVHHKKGTRRYYCLSATYVPAQHRTMPSPYDTEEAYYQWGVLCQ